MIKEFSEVNGLGSKRTLSAVIEHYRDQADGIGTEVDNIHIDLFKRLVGLAEKQFASGDLESLAITMMDLGSIIKRIRMPYDYHIQDKGVAIQQAKAVTAHYNSTAQHREKTQKLNLVKEYAQDIARLLWSRDLEQKMRVGAMTEEVYKYLIDYCEYMSKGDDKHNWIDSFLPENHDSRKYREWIKEVAPSYATKGGAPKK
jgi:hypothetical protein